MEMSERRQHPDQMVKRIRKTVAAPRYMYFFQQWRKHRGLTQAQLAEAADLSESAVSQIENHKMGFMSETLEAMATALSCHPGDLLREDPTAKTGKDAETVRMSLMRNFDELSPSAQETVLIDLMQQKLNGARLPAAQAE